MKLSRKVGEKGQVTIPKDIRDMEGINPDSEVFFHVEEGKIVLEKVEGKLSETLRNVSGDRDDEDDQIKNRMKKAGIDL